MPTNPSQFTTTGRIGKMRQFTINGDTPVMGLNVAIDDDYMDKNGQWVDQTVWTYIEVFGKRAEWVRDNLRVGDSIFINGKIKMSVNQQGQQWLKFWASDIRHLSRPSGGQQEPAPSEAPDSRDYTGHPNPDHIPF